MAFEKQKRNNKIMMAIGIVLAVIGFAAYAAVSWVIGILLMILGVAIIVITFSISNVFYRIEMKELLENKKRTK